jgi:hypothetical protein
MPQGTKGETWGLLAANGPVDGMLSAIAPLRGDDWLFGISACDGDFCSPVSSAVPGGAFEPVEQPEE